MPGAQERVLRRRIGSIQNTKKITRAMELIAATRVVKAQMAHRVHHYNGYSVDLNLYQAVIKSGQEPQPLRVAEVRWVPSNEFEKYPFPAADQATTDLLLGFRR